MKKLHLVVSVLLIVAAAIASAVCYLSLPLSVPIHWGLDGQPNQYGPRLLAALLGPGLMSGLLIAGLRLPRLSPRYFGPNSIQPTYSYSIAVLVAILGLVHAAILHALVTGSETLARPYMAGVCVLLILLGNPMGKLPRNPFVGVRTAATMANVRVWHATQRMGARLMVASGLLGLFAVALDAPPWVLLLLISIWAILIVAYASYIRTRFKNLRQS